jgi:hypothetical protein
VCVGDELTDDSASTLHRPKSKRSTFPGGGAFSPEDEGVEWDPPGLLMQLVRQGSPQYVQWLSLRR